MYFSAEVTRSAADPIVAISGVTPEPAPANAVGQASPSVGRIRLGVEDFTTMCWGIILAAMAYPFLGGLIGFAVTAPWWFDDLARSVREEGVSFLLLLPVMYGMIAVTTGSIGAAWALLIMACLLPLMVAIKRTLKLQVPAAWFGAILGGLTGALAVVPLFAAAMIEGDAIARIAAVFLGPGLATILGQIGGAWGGALRRNEGRPIASHREGVDARAITEWPRSISYRFQVRHLLWATFWLSVVLSLLRLVGLPMAPTLVVLVAWAVFQSLTLAAGYQFCTRVWPRFRAPRIEDVASRSTWNNR